MAHKKNMTEAHRINITPRGLGEVGGLLEYRKQWLDAPTYYLVSKSKYKKIVTMDVRGDTIIHLYDKELAEKQMERMP